MVVLGAGKGGITEKFMWERYPLSQHLAGLSLEVLGREVVPQAGPARVSELERLQNIKCVLAQKDLPAPFGTSLTVSSREAELSVDQPPPLSEAWFTLGPSQSHCCSKGFLPVHAGN